MQFAGRYKSGRNISANEGTIGESEVGTVRATENAPQARDASPFFAPLARDGRASASEGKGVGRGRGGRRGFVRGHWHGQQNPSRSSSPLLRGERRERSGWVWREGRRAQRRWR